MRSERYSETSEIKEALIRNGCGPVLYYENGNTWNSEKGHALYLGKTGVGKSWSGTINLITSLREKGESFVVTDPKGEIYKYTGHAACKTHNTMVIDLRNVCKSTRWSPLSYIYRLYSSGIEEERQSAFELLEDLSIAIFPGEGKGVDPFWDESARDVFIGAVYALMETAESDQVTMANVFKVISSGQERYGGRSTYLNQYVELFPENSIVRSYLAGLLCAPSETSGSILSTFYRGMSIFSRSPGLISMLSEDELDIYGIKGDKPLAIYIILPDETPIYNALAGILTGQLMNHFVRLAYNKYDGCLPIRLNFCLEELGNIGKALSNLDYIMSAGRSRGIRCQLVLQSLSQLESIYGKSKAKTILDNVDVWIAFRLNDWETLVELSNKVGTRDVWYGKSRVTEPLITPVQLSAMGIGQALVMIPGGIKFISYLPAFSQICDLSKIEFPEKQLSAKNNEPKWFDIKSFVKDGKIRNFKQMAATSVDSPFEGASNAAEKTGEAYVEVDISASKKIPDNNIQESSKNFDTEELIKRIDEKIKELEEEENKERLNSNNTSRNVLCAVRIDSVKGYKSAVTKVIHDNSSLSLKQIKSKLDNLPCYIWFKDENTARHALKEVITAGGIAEISLSADCKF